jgi:hypothetical protein
LYGAIRDIGISFQPSVNHAFMFSWRCGWPHSARSAGHCFIKNVEFNTFGSDNRCLGRAALLASPGLRRLRGSAALPERGIHRERGVVRKKEFNMYDCIPI